MATKNPFSLYNPARAEEMVTKSLIKEGLFSNKPTESLGKKCDNAKIVSSPKEHFQFPHDSVFLSDPKKRVAYLFRAATDPEFAGVVNRDRAIIMSSPLGRFMGPSPVSLRDSTLRELIEKGVFHPNHSHDPIIESAAFLMERGLNTKELLEQYAPPFDFEEFHRYQSKVNRIIDKNLPETHRIFEKFWNDPKLKPPIKYAIKVAILENENRESLIQVAKRVRISYETLRSRIKAGTSILKRYFPHLIPLDELPKRPKPKHRERQFGGFFLRSSGQKIYPVYRIDPKTGVKTLDTSRDGVGYKTLKKTPVAGIQAQKSWEAITSYHPKHNGVESPLLAHLANAYPCSVRLGLATSGRSHVKFVSADEKAAFTSTKPVKFSKKETPAAERGQYINANLGAKTAKLWNGDVEL